MGYVEDDSYDENALAEFLKKEPGLMQFKVIGVAVKLMKDNPISIDARKIKKGGLFKNK